jgi:hypothetical protein
MFAERFICSWIGAFGLAAGAFCQTYVQFSIDRGIIQTSINKKGQIAGTYVDFAGNSHGFVRHPGGKITTFDVPGSSGTRGDSINDVGAITGTYPASGRNLGYVRDPEGNITPFDTPGSIDSGVIISINAGGFVTGNYRDLNFVLHGFVREPSGHIISFDAPDGISTTAVSINAKGAITGSYVDANNRTHGFLRRADGTIVSIDVPESTSTSAASINDAGAITGSVAGLHPPGLGLCA